MPEVNQKLLSSSRQKAYRLFRREIWKTQYLHDKSLHGRFYAILRILCITGNGLLQSRIPVQAAALSYYSLIALGPLVAIIVMISGFVLDRGDSDLALNSLNRVMTFIAPSVAEMTKIETSENEEVSSEDSLEASNNLAKKELENNLTSLEEEPSGSPPDPQIVLLINNFIENARSGTVGAFGGIMLILIGIQLLTSIEKTFNEIWNVKQGRKIVERIVFYWTFISLGAVLSFSSATLISAATIVSLLEDLPFGPVLAQFIIWMAPVLSYAIIVGLLAFFYRFFPNTNVNWRPALIGALIVSCLLFLNNFLSFIYVFKVVSSKSLYGSLGIFPVLMFGMYVFWLFILLGCQITYAVQNCNFLTNRQAWKDISASTCEMLCLVAFLLVCRRFKNGQEPVTEPVLVEIIRAPALILKECLNRLSDLGWINPVGVHAGKGRKVVSYAPAKPLDQISVGEFKQSIEGYGNREGIELIHEIDPVIDYYSDHWSKFLDKGGINNLNFEKLLEQMPLPDLKPASS